MKIKSAAVKHTDGTVSAGKKHKLIPGNGKEGFVTGGGKFVGRVEAGKMAKKSGQANVKVLHSHNLKKSKT